MYFNIYIYIYIEESNLFSMFFCYPKFSKQKKKGLENKQTLFFIFFLFPISKISLVLELSHTAPLLQTLAGGWKYGTGFLLLFLWA